MLWQNIDNIERFPGNVEQIPVWSKQINSSLKQLQDLRALFVLPTKYESSVSEACHKVLDKYNVDSSSQYLKYLSKNIGGVGETYDLYELPEIRNVRHVNSLKKYIKDAREKVLKENEFLSARGIELLGNADKIDLSI